MICWWRWWRVDAPGGWTHRHLCLDLWRLRGGFCDVFGGKCWAMKWRRKPKNIWCIYIYWKYMEYMEYWKIMVYTWIYGHRYWEDMLGLYSKNTHWEYMFYHGIYMVLYNVMGNWMLWELMLGIPILNFLYGDMWFFFFAVFEINEPWEGKAKIWRPHWTRRMFQCWTRHSDYHFPVCHWF